MPPKVKFAYMVPEIASLLKNVVCTGFNAKATTSSPD
jgi:hypothetical protein